MEIAAAPLLQRKHRLVNYEKWFGTAKVECDASVTSIISGNVGFKCI